ncbi:bifunctional phosphoribosyl-AMP cyclohydrolase/phosphoribosyl-ATP diphosphatase HisIE [Flavobacterium aquatile]|uniref:Histidine biosynthesis bifunctional protein HisIE n=1 Tax=Flavobacterium aquatile LMG 4008 = ATCC 11947 TaxID=1453498 RepID=A0A095U2U4_9FLAO|nr:bifunctional phosphoribosyl-AMP cyclohydrolase/phosphoribosyl-ATP diphosphatase HisIE [Flavobacterium aquatile]KGD68923.1 phosphoribosyl-ATP pyrophosphatase [Flavobacterium aquatile LMG 4008 = ATCC 11947]OXA65635.1 bifunctional phosphoribosyl-AMP cyclohydrolase/phosphoribosyl-ATP diphosphatase [Flavobacterium aquatile LMG 4008 = ATCC 11947]GEC79572.1 histidine biosynthesis bifunctional protein HisIE [Flavobacterium aquatile]
MKVDFSKNNGLIPVIIQNNETQQVLMLGYMNEEAFQKTQKENIVTFFSRSKNRLWTKGETSRNFLKVVSIKEDCDQDALLIQVIPNGPTCHNGTTSCFATEPQIPFLNELENVIENRISNPSSESYVASLFQKGINKMAQKVGEEAVELVIEAKDDNQDLFIGEAADLLFHYLILLQAKNLKLNDIEQELMRRMKK